MRRSVAGRCWIRAWIRGVAWVVAACLVAPFGIAAETGNAVGGDEDLYRWSLPEGLAPPPVPETNPMSEAKVALGRRLFSDPRLSFNGTTSCATCHDPARDFTDGRALSVGASGEPVARHTPSLWNVAYNVSFTWIDQGLTRLEAQLRIPLLGRAPVEMGFGRRQAALLARDPEIAALHRAAFGPARRGGRELGEQSVIDALAAYVRTLIRMDSAFDRLLYWDDASDIDADARRGMALFFSDRLGCIGCHAGPHLSGPTAEPGRDVAPVFHRTAVSGARETFRAPSLRFVSRTAPYMHDGSLATLDAVVDFYARGGGEGAEHLRSFELRSDERRALLAFLRAL